MCSFYHLPFSYKLADSDSHSDSGADTQFCLYLHVIGVFLHIRQSHAGTESEGADIVRSCRVAGLHGLVNIRYTRDLNPSGSW